MQQTTVRRKFNWIAAARLFSAINCKSISTLQNGCPDIHGFFFFLSGTWRLIFFAAHKEKVCPHCPCASVAHPHQPPPHPPPLLCPAWPQRATDLEQASAFARTSPAAAALTRFCSLATHCVFSSHVQRMLLDARMPGIMPTAAAWGQR
jgi:hypothetical protein